MKSTQGLIFIAVLFLVIGALLVLGFLKFSNRVCYQLPKNMDADVFGKFYWNALHDTVERIPCSICQTEAVSFMSFFHDVVNNKLGKKLYDENNFNKWLERLSELKNKRDGE